MQFSVFTPVSREKSDHTRLRGTKRDWSSLGLDATILPLRVLKHSWGARRSSFLAKQEVKMPQNIFGSDTGQAVPGGNLAKPLVIALLALLASRYFSGGGQKDAQAPSPDATRFPDLSAPGSRQEASPGSILDGLGGLVEQFQNKGLGDVIDSWVNRGTNKSIAPDQVSVALGRDVIDDLSLRTGLSRDEVVTELARMLPNAVDKLTPEGRLPTQQEIMRLMS
jgi:uncharacterized protein YidB (DUF937 family)